MPPKVINLGAKKGLPLPPPVANIKLKLPSSLIPSLDGRDILTDTEIQQTINSNEKSRRRGFAASEEDKLPRYIIDGVSFSVLTAEILNKKVIMIKKKPIKRNELRKV